APISATGRAIPSWWHAATGLVCWQRCRETPARALTCAAAQTSSTWTAATSPLAAMSTNRSDWQTTSTRLWITSVSGQRPHRAFEHGVFDRGERAGVLTTEGTKDVDRRGRYRALCRDTVNEAKTRGVVATEAASGRHRGHCRGWGEFGLDQCGHARREGDADVHFGKAEVAAVSAHYPKVVRQRQHCSCAERV